MKLKGLKAVISAVKTGDGVIIHYNSNTGKIFVTEREIIYTYTGLFCITAMMDLQGYRFDGTMNGLKTFMEANEHYFNKKGGE